MINMQRALKDPQVKNKADSMQEQTGNVSREMEILRKNQNEMLEIKTTETEMETALDRLIGTMITAQKKIPELDSIYRILKNSFLQN